MQTSSGFGGPPQVSRRDSHDQIHMMAQRMKQVSIQSQLPMYQNGTYHDSRFQYDQAPSSYNERSLYFGGYYSATPHSNSYPNIVSRGKDGTVGKMLYRFKKYSFFHGFWSCGWERPWEGLCFFFLTVMMMIMMKMPFFIKDENPTLNDQRFHSSKSIYWVLASSGM